MVARKHVLLKGEKIFYRQWSEGSYPLFCLPGWPATSLCFAQIAEEIGKKLSIITIDYPGWGGTPELKSGQTDIFSFIDVAKRFINSFDYPKYSLMGYSFGGLILQALLAEKAVKPEKIILMSTFRNIEKHIQKSQYRNIHKLMTTLSKAHSSNETLKKLVTKYLYHVDLKIGSTKNIKSDNFVALLKEMEQTPASNIFNSVSSISTLQIPLLDFSEYDPLVLYAERDLPFVIEDSREMAYNSNFKQAIIEDCNHNHAVIKPRVNAQFICKHILG